MHGCDQQRARATAALAPGSRADRRGSRRGRRQLAAPARNFEGKECPNKVLWKDVNGERAASPARRSRGQGAVPPGRRTVKTEPLPGSLFTVTSPPIMRASSPRHAHADIALEGNALLATHGLQIAGIAVDADVAGQLAGDATAAFERGAAVAPRLDGVGVDPDGVETIGAPPHVALEIGLPHRAGAAESPPQQRAYAPGEHVGAVVRDGRETLTQRIVERGALPNPLDLRLERQPRH